MSTMRSRYLSNINTLFNGLLTSKNVNETVVQVFSEYDPQSVLDVGCGPGVLTARIKDECGLDEIYGVDISGDAVEAAQQRGIAATQLNLDNDPLPFADEKFDAVFSTEVIDYLTNTDQYFSEIYRVLKKEGMFVISTVNLTSIHNRFAMALGRSPFPMRPEHDCVHTSTGPGIIKTADRINVLQLDDVKSAIHRHGFTVEEIYGCTVEEDTLSLPLRILDYVSSYFPKYSYRFLFICKK